MYRFESAVMSCTTPINGSVPFPPWGSAMKSATQRARIQKLGVYVNVAKRLPVRISGGSFRHGGWIGWKGKFHIVDKREMKRLLLRRNFLHQHYVSRLI